MKRNWMALLAASAMYIPAAAEAAPYEFHIAPQPLAQALEEFGRESSVQIVFTPAVVGDKLTQGVAGSLEPVDALKQLLAGSGLTFKPSGAGYIIVPAAATTAGPAVMRTSAAGAPPSPEPISGAQPTRLAEVVVTANRQAQNLQKVSAAVTVVSGASLREEGLNDIGQIVADLPGVQATAQPGGFSIDVRGMGGDLPAGTTQGSVALEFDGVYNINSQGTTVGFFDVDRIEVLPGPQSTRYGPDADGGVVNVITKDPVIGKFTGYASVELGSYGLVRTEAAVNLPVNDQLALRLSEATLSRGSYFSPEEGNARDQSFRAKLLYKPTDRLSLKLSYQMDHVGGTGNGSNAFPMFSDKVPIYSGDSINNYSDPWKHGDVEAPGQGESGEHASIYQHTVVGNLSYRINDAMALDVLSSYSTLTGGETGCLMAPPWSTTPGGPFPICGTQEKEFEPFYQYSEEVRLHNAAGSPVLWNLGYYHWNYLWQYQLVDASFLSTSQVLTTTATNAIYGDITYPLTDRLRVIGGLRESADHRRFNFSNGAAPTPTFGINLSHFDYRAGLEYDLARTSMLYFTVATGYRPGGLSSYDSVSQSPLSFKAETNTAFELGSKNRLLSNRLQLNADIFYYRQKDYQNLDQYTGFYINVAGASIECTNQTRSSYAACVNPTWNLNAQTLGFETQARFAATDNDMLGFTGTWLDAKFDKKQGTCAQIGINASVPGYAGPGCYDGYNNMVSDDLEVYNMAGAVEPHSPTFSGNFTYDHTFHPSWGGKVVIGGNAYYSTGYWLNPVEDADRYGWQPAYVLGNVHVAYTPAGADWSINAYVHNVSDYAVKESVLPVTAIGDPRTFGVVLSKTW